LTSLRDVTFSHEPPLNLVPHMAVLLFFRASLHRYPSFGGLLLAKGAKSDTDIGHSYGEAETEARITTVFKPFELAIFAIQEGPIIIMQRSQRACLLSRRNCHHF
ncbi:MAG: hypothetical protein JXQ89_23475, partial [Pelagimonas sp.]